MKDHSSFFLAWPVRNSSTISKNGAVESAKKVDAIAGRAAIPMYPLWGVARAHALCALCDLYSKGYYDTVAPRRIIYNP